MIIVISKPTFIDDESGLVNELFKEGLELFHIRKPGCEKGDLINLLKGIKEEFYSRIALHQYHEIAVEYNINRLHFPEANRRDADVVKLKEQYILSTSTHSLNDFNYDLNAYDYCFYGPVFNSEICRTGDEEVSRPIGSVHRRFDWKQQLRRALDLVDEHRARVVNESRRVLLGSPKRSWVIEVESGGIRPGGQSQIRERALARLASARDKYDPGVVKRGHDLFHEMAAAEFGEAGRVHCTHCGGLVG